MEIKIVNCTTGEEIVRDATQEEIDNLKKSQLDAQRGQAEAQVKREAKAALLERLGITADEAALLVQ